MIDLTTLTSEQAYLHFHKTFLIPALIGFLLLVGILFWVSAIFLKGKYTSLGKFFNIWMVAMFLGAIVILGVYLSPTFTKDLIIKIVEIFS